MFRYFRELQPQEQCVIGADPADGGSDHCAAVVKSKKQADSPMVYNERNDSAQFGHELHKMAKFVYSKTGIWPMIGVERNTGMATIHVLETLNYPKLFRMKLIGKKPNKMQDLMDAKIGWQTNMQTRPLMLDDLALSMRQKVNKIYDPKTIEQIRKFIRNPRTGKPEAGPNAKDDLVFAEAIAWQLYQLVPADKGASSLQSLANQFPEEQVLDQYGNPTV